MKRWLILFFLLGLSAMQVSLGSRLNFSLNLILIFLLYLLFYQFRWSLEFFLLSGWLFDIQSHLTFGVFLLIFWLLFMIMCFFSRHLNQRTWRQKFIFLLTGLIIYSLLIAGLMIFRQMVFNWSSAVFLIKSFLINFILACFIWYLFDYFKDRFWLQQA